ncbi:MAG: WHG domain-containing protein [Clostridia bacterium]|nr:WHG domain-containing protein [Clostridia bacterium]
MPPKAKFTREEVISAALGIVREKGTDALTARELGVRLGSSARPIFTLYSGMEEVLRDTVRAARDLYNSEYIARGLQEPLSFRGVGAAYIRFACEEPQLFHLLFMGKHGESVNEILPRLDENYSDILRSITGAYSVTEAQAERLYQHLWVYSHGIATLCATGACVFTGEDIERMLTEIFLALYLKLQKGEEA